MVLFLLIIIRNVWLEVVLGELLGGLVVAEAVLEVVLFVGLWVGVVERGLLVKLLFEVGLLLLYALSLVCGSAVSTHLVILYKPYWLLLQILNMSVLNLRWCPYPSILSWLTYSIAKSTQLISIIHIITPKRRYLHLRLIKTISRIANPLHGTFLNPQQLPILLNRIPQPTHQRFMSLLSIVLDYRTGEWTLPFIVTIRIVSIVSIAVIISWPELIGLVLGIESWVGWRYFYQLSKHRTHIGNCPVILHFHLLLLSSLLATIHICYQFDSIFIF